MLPYVHLTIYKQLHNGPQVGHLCKGKHHCNSHPYSSNIRLRTLRRPLLSPPHHMDFLNQATREALTSVILNRRIQDL